MIKRTLLLLCFCFSMLGFAATSLNKCELSGYTSLQLERANELCKALRTENGYYSSAYIYTKRTVSDYEKEPEKLAARMSLLGFTDVYLAFLTDEIEIIDNPVKWQQIFIRTAHSYGMKVHALTLSSGNLFVGNKRLYEDCNNLINYNYSVKKAERFDGVTADLEPHVHKKNFVDNPKDLTLFWDSKENMGIGKDNDLLLKRVVDVMRMAKKEIDPMPLSQAVGFFVQNRVNEGLLSNGDASQYLNYCNWLIVMAYNRKMERIWDMAEPTIKAAKDKEKTVSIAIKTSRGTFGDEGDATTLQIDGWNNLITTINFLFEKGKQEKAFRGIDVFEFQGLEIMFNNP